MVCFIIQIFGTRRFSVISFTTPSYCLVIAYLMVLKLRSTRFASVSLNSNFYIFYSILRIPFLKFFAQNSLPLLYYFILLSSSMLWLSLLLLRLLYFSSLHLIISSQNTLSLEVYIVYLLQYKYIECYFLYFSL